MATTLALLNDSRIGGNFWAPIGAAPDGIAYDPANELLYVASYAAGYVEEVNATTGHLFGWIRDLGSPSPMELSWTMEQPTSVSYDGANGNLYVTDAGLTNITVVNGGTGQVTAIVPVGVEPLGVAIDLKSDLVFVANLQSSNLTVINGSANRAVGSIDVGGAPDAVVYDSKNGDLYVSDAQYDRVSVVSARSRNVTKTINVGDDPDAMTYDMSDHLVYVANSGSNTVTEIDVLNNSIARTIGVGSGPDALCVDPKNGNVYVADGGSAWSGGYSYGNVTVISGSTGTPIASLSVGAGPDGLAVDPASGYVYVADAGNIRRGFLSTNLTVIDGASETIAGSLTIGATPTSLAYDPGASGAVIVTDGAADTVSILNGTSNLVTQTAPVGIYPDAAAVDPTSNKIFVANAVSDNVTVLNASTYKSDGSISVGGYPDAATYDPLNGNVYVANMDSDNVSVINGTSNDVVTSIGAGVGVWPDALTFDPANGCIYVADGHFEDVYVQVINGSTNSVTESIAVGSSPDGLSYDPEDGFVYVADQSSGSVTVLNGSSNTVVASTGWSDASPDSVATDWANGNIYVGNGNLNGIYGYFDYLEVVSDQTNQANGSIPVGLNPISVLYDGDNGELLVANYLSGTISALGGPDLTAYPVSFEETGVPTGETWSVTVGNLTESSSNSTITIFRANGTYFFDVAAPGLIASPDQGETVINGTPQVLRVAFRPPERFSAQFLESGLPSATPWWVNVSGQSSQGSVGSTISLNLSNGTYAYSVATADKSYSSSGGILTVNGAPTETSVTFSLVTYQATFTETGLPPGTEWWVNLAKGENSSSTTSSITMSEPNGSYLFVVSTADDRYSSLGGTFAVSGAVVAIAIDFSLVTYAVTFDQSGSPSGVKWWVNLTGGETFSSTTGTIRFYEPNGTYAYSLATADKCYSSTGGTLTVRGTEVSMSVTFSLVTFLVTFVESGLAPGTSWSITLNDSTNVSTRSSVTFAGPNATYAYTVGRIAGYTSNVTSGNLTIAGLQQTIFVGFTAMSRGAGALSPRVFIAIGVLIAAFAAGGVTLTIILRRHRHPTMPHSQPGAPRRPPPNQA